MQLCVFHFMPPYTCSVFPNLKLCTILGSLVFHVIAFIFTSIKAHVFFESMLPKFHNPQFSGVVSTRNSTNFHALFMNSYISQFWRETQAKMLQVRQLAAFSFHTFLRAPKSHSLLVSLRVFWLNSRYTNLNLTVFQENKVDEYHIWL
jgi:ABC-type protease/lipase transport system fused ATPase/permease subunit